MVGIALFLKKVNAYKELATNLCYLSGNAMIMISIPYGGYMACSVYSLYQTNMTANRYLILMPACDFLFLGMWSSMFLKRAMSMYHWMAFLCAAGAYFLYDFLEYDGLSQTNWNLVSKPGWKGPVFCIISRMCFILMGSLSKRLLMKQGYKIKVKQFERLARQKKIQEKDIDEFGQAKDRWVKEESMVYRRAMLHKRLNIRNKEQELVDLVE